jgi:O-antigen ligase
MTGLPATAHARVVGLSVAALILAPLLTVTLPYRRALVAQAALVSAATLVFLIFAVLRKRRSERTSPPRPLLIGVALYAAAAVHGAVVALVRGNELTLIAGQLLAMGLLPLAAVAAFEYSPAIGWRSFATGLVCGVTASALIQLAVSGLSNLGNPDGSRLMLPNAVSATGAAPLALLLALALSRSGRPLARTLTWAATGVILLLIFGSLIRSQWVVMPLGVAAYLGIGFSRATLFSRRVALGFGVASLLVACVAATAVWWWTHPRPNLVAGVLDSGATEGGTAVAVLPAKADGAIRVRGTLSCQGSGPVSVRVRGTSASPEHWAGAKARLVVAGSAPASFQIVLRPSADEKQLSVEIEDPERLACRSTSLVVEDIAPADAAQLAGHILGLFHRPPDPGAGPTAGAFAGDASIAFRLREASAVMAATRSGSWSSWVFGHGLGATFEFKTLGYDNRGNIVRYDRPNYIHNFYLFLLFKLGLLGTLEVLTALTLFVCATVKGAKAWPPGNPDRFFLAAVAAAWITYITWSVAAPEILDFRFAPLWGVLVAITASVLQAGNRNPHTIQDTSN